MKCKTIIACLNAYADGELPHAKRRTVKDHLATCAACQQRLENVRLLDEMLNGNSQVPPLPDGFTARVLAEARSKLSEQKPTMVSSRVVLSPVQWFVELSTPLRAAAVAVLAVGLLSGILMARSTLPTPPSISTVQTTPETDQLAQYNIDYFGDAPHGSLANSYFLLTSVNNMEGQ